MCISISSDKPRPVNRKYNMQFLKTHIMQDLIVSSLEKRRIYRHHRNKPRRGNSCSKCHGMFLRYAHIKSPVRKPLCKYRHTGSFSHGRCDRHNPVIFFPKLHKLSGKHPGVCHSLLLFQNMSRLYVKWINAMEITWMAFCMNISFSLYRLHVNKYRSVKLECLSEGCLHDIYIMSVYWSYVCHAKLLKEHARYQYLFYGILGFLKPLCQMFSGDRNLHKDLLHIAFEVIVLLSNSEFAQIC